MSAATRRMRMFAGPNGSGKSVLKSYLPAELLGVYLNPDEIEAGTKQSGFLDVSAAKCPTWEISIPGVETDGSWVYLAEFVAQ